MPVAYFNRRGFSAEKRFRPEAPKYAAVAHLVERHLAKVEVASSSLVSRSKRKHLSQTGVFFLESGKI